MNHVKVYSSVAFSTLTRLCKPHLCLISKHSCHPKKALYPLSSHSRHPSLQTTGTRSLHSVSSDLPILDVSEKWDHITWSCVSGFFLRAVL